MRGELVLRLQHALSGTALEALNEDFADIIEGEPIRAIDVTEDERGDDDWVDLPRITFGFDRKSYARLHELIGVLNNY